MNAATQLMAEVLRARDWHFEINESTQMIDTGFAGRNGQWRIVTGGVNEFAVIILSGFPVGCPEPRRRACSELLTRINYNLVVGCFEMKFDDGRIHYRSTVTYEKELPRPEVLDHLLSLNLITMDLCLPAIMSVIYAGINPAKAIDILEKAEAAAKQAKTKPSHTRPKSHSRFELN